MRRLCLAWICAAALLQGAARAGTHEQALQESFLEGVRLLREGDYERAAAVLRELLGKTGSPRVKLELARALFHAGKHREAKALFQEVAQRPDTPWRVRDNIEHFVRDIEARTGYWKMGVALVQDSNPRNLTSQREFSIGGVALTFTPAQPAERVTGLRVTGSGSTPVIEPLQAAGYLTASYVDYPNEDLDRLTVDAGIAKSLTASGRVRAKAGIEFGTLGGSRLYSFPYAGVASLLAASPAFRLEGELKAGKVEFPDFPFLDARYASAALSARRALWEGGALSLGARVESSRARERPYSYYGMEIGPGLSTLWEGSAFLVDAAASIGSRKYEEADPIFGRRRSDLKRRLEITVGNKRWRWLNHRIASALSLESNRSSVEFYSYEKVNLSITME